MSSIPNWSPPPGGSNYYNGFPQQMCFDENYLYFPNLSPNCISQTKLSDGSINNYYYFDSSNNPDFNGPKALVVYNENIYASTLGGNIIKIKINNVFDNSTWIANSNFNQSYGLAVYNDYMYCLVPVTGKIIRININNTIDVSYNWVTGLTNPYALTIYENYIYVSNNTSDIVRINISDPTDITNPWTTGFQKSCGLAVYNNYMYVSNTANNTISRINMLTNNIDYNWFNTGLVNPSGLSINTNYIYVYNDVTEGFISKIFLEPIPVPTPTPTPVPVPTPTPTPKPTPTPQTKKIYPVPNPPREWTRFENRCPLKSSTVTETPLAVTPFSAYYIDEYRKGNILQYKANSSNLTKNQRYSQIAKGKWTNRTTTWATQTDQYTNPNTNFLQRVNTGQIVTNPNNNIIDSNNNVTYINGLCPVLPKIANNVFLPGDPMKGTNNPTIPKPPPPGSGGNNPNLPPPVPIPPTDVVIIPDGGNMLCNITENPCTGQIIDKTYTKDCYPSSDSDVPGPEVLLCWNDVLQTYYPRVRRTYATSGNKWPQGSKTILPSSYCITETPV